MELTCPKCRSTMRQYERSGVVIDQCESCRGIFLDRGELEKLADAENRFHAGGAPSHAPPPPHAAPQPYGAPPPPAPAPHGWHGSGWHGHHHRGHHHRGYQHGHRKRRSFLDGLFD